MKMNRREWLAALLSLPILSKIGLGAPAKSAACVTASDSVTISDFEFYGIDLNPDEPGSMYWHGKSPLAYLPYVGPLPWEKKA